MGLSNSKANFKIRETRERKDAELNIENCGLSSLPEVTCGCIGESIGDLEITKLNASHNHIKTLSRCLQDMRLTTVNLSYNVLNNIDMLASIKTIVDIDVSHNIQLREIVDFPYCESLNISATVLDASENYIPALPEEISNLKLLTVLDLTSNPISTLPRQIGDVKTLKVLKLGKNPKLTSLPETFSNLSNLEVLNLSGTKVKEIDINFKHWKHLREFEYTSGDLVSFSTKSALSIPYLTSLEHLILSYNKLKAAPKELGLLPSLRHLDLSSNDLHRIPGEFCFLNPAKVAIELEQNPLKEPFNTLLSTGVASLLKSIKIYCSAYAPNCYITEPFPKPLIAAKPNEFVLQACDFGNDPRGSGKDTFDGKIVCKRGGLKGKEVDIFIRDRKHEPGKYSVLFNLPEEGIYSLSITSDGKQIKSSPFILRTEEFLDAPLESDDEGGDAGEASEQETDEQETDEQDSAAQREHNAEEGSDAAESTDGAPSSKKDATATEARGEEGAEQAGKCGADAAESNEDITKKGIEDIKDDDIDELLNDLNK